MNRRTFLRNVAVLGAAGSLTSRTAQAEEKAPANKPNIIFILTDDQGWGDTGYNGHPIIKTPGLDAMAQNGLQFDRFYAAAAMCSPTRATCMTGRNNWRSGIASWMKSGQGHLPAEEITLPEFLKTKGYVSGHFGKWHLGGFAKERAGRHKMDPGMAGFDEWFSTYNVMPTFDPYGVTFKTDIDQYWDNGRNITLAEGSKTPSLRGEDATIVMNKAVEFIDKQVKADKPFMAAIWYHHVHMPLRQNPEFAKLYPGHGTKETTYYANVSALDSEIVRLRKHLRTLGIAENTMLWFASDNGPLRKDSTKLHTATVRGQKFVYSGLGSAGAYRGVKGELYEGGIRVPGILEWPAKIKKHRKTNMPCVTTDYVPTVLDALGIALPKDRIYDGISLMPLTEGKTDKRTEPIGFKCKGMTAWMTERYKLLRMGTREPWQLFDMQKDPYETTDLSKAKPEVFKELLGQCGVWVKSCEKDFRAVLEKYPRGTGLPKDEAATKKEGKKRKDKPKAP